MAKVTGADELIANLEALNVTVQSAARGACNAVAQAVKDQAIANARSQGLVSTGALVNNIAVKRETPTPPTIAEYHIGVRHGSEAKSAEKIAIRGANGRLRFEYVNDPFYWWFWEIGHYNVFLRRHVAARAFLRPAMDLIGPRMPDIAGAYLAERLERTTLKAIGA